MTQLKAGMRKLKVEIDGEKGIKDRELKVQKEEFLSHVRISEQDNEEQQQESGNTLQKVIQSIMQLQKEIKILGQKSLTDKPAKKKQKTERKHKNKSEGK